VKRTRIEILLVVLTVMALSAGVVAGLVAARLPAATSAAKSDNVPPPIPPGPMEKSLAEELQLTADQREQMRAIWEGVRDKVHQAFDEAQDLGRQRDQRLVAILSDEQKAQFEKISKEFAEKYNQLARERDDAFNGAVEKTKKLLNETQRKKYEEILKTHVRPGSPGGAGAGGGKMIIASPVPTVPAASQPLK
jgi:Spy/CpxP family protein refolding chaperone